MIERIRKALCYQIEEKGKNKFVIFPYGNVGKIIKRVLNEEFGINEIAIADSYICNEHIMTVNHILEILHEDDEITVLLGVDNCKMEVCSEVHQILDDIDLERIADILNPSLYFNPWCFYDTYFITNDIRHYTTECIEREIYHNSIEGAVAEAGVYKGNTAKYINYIFPDRKLYLFDTFEGFSIDEQKNDDLRGLHNEKLNFSDTNVDVVMSKMSFRNNCIVRKGRFPESAKGINEKFAFVRLDMDLYDPIMAGLEFFYPKMTKGGYISIHDCRSNNFDGARTAVGDFCRKMNCNYMCMPDALGTAVIPIGY